VADIKAAFGPSSSIYTLKPSEETSNVVVVAVKAGAPNDGSSSAKMATKPWKVLEEWLKSVNINADPLELGELVDKFCPIE
jgi:hypothetical protein